jgi:hypothetical protein
MSFGETDAWQSLRLSSRNDFVDEAFRCSEMSSGGRAPCTGHLLKVVRRVTYEASRSSNAPVFTRNLPNFAEIVAEIAGFRSDNIANDTSSHRADGDAS